MTLPAGGTTAGPSAGGLNHLPEGTRFDEFEVRGLLGEGGFSVVYRAYDHQLHRDVAIKEYMPASVAHRGSDATVRARPGSHEEAFHKGLDNFIEEARLLARFEHPALVKVHRFWRLNGTAYMVMPLYRGSTLRETLRRLPGPPPEAWLRQMLAPLMDALAMIHAQQCYHRDIAPDNVLILENGQPLLLDFGAARRVIGDVTQALTVILKPGFAPIEQYANDASMKQGPWTDVYALGALVHYCATGRAPPPSVTRVLKDSLQPLHELAPALYSPVFGEAIWHALRPSAEERTASIAQLREELDRGSAGGAAALAPMSTDSPWARAATAAWNDKAVTGSGGVSGGVDPDATIGPGAATWRGTGVPPGTGRPSVTSSSGSTPSALTPSDPTQASARTMPASTISPTPSTVATPAAGPSGPEPAQTVGAVPSSGRPPAMRAALIVGVVGALGVAAWLTVGGGAGSSRGPGSSSPASAIAPTPDGVGTSASAPTAASAGATVPTPPNAAPMAAPAPSAAAPVPAPAPAPVTPVPVPAPPPSTDTKTAVDEARKAQTQAEEAKARAEAERSKALAEAARSKAEADAMRARLEADAAKAEADAARRRVETEAARSRAAGEATRANEPRTPTDADAQARREADKAALLRAEAEREAAERRRAERAEAERREAARAALAARASETPAPAATPNLAPVDVAASSLAAGRDLAGGSTLRFGNRALRLSEGDWRVVSAGPTQLDYQDASGPLTQVVQGWRVRLSRVVGGRVRQHVVLVLSTQSGAHHERLAWADEFCEKPRPRSVAHEFNGSFNQPACLLVQRVAQPGESLGPVLTGVLGGAVKEGDLLISYANHSMGNYLRVAIAGAPDSLGSEAGATGLARALSTSLRALGEYAARSASLPRLPD